MKAADESLELAFHHITKAQELHTIELKEEHIAFELRWLERTRFHLAVAKRRRDAAQKRKAGTK